MKAEENNLPADGDTGTAPLFTEEAEEEARPVIPLPPVVSARPPRGKATRNLTLALAMLAAGAAGAAAGYLAFTRETPEPPATVTTGTAPQPAATHPVTSNTSEALTRVATGARRQVEAPARVESELPRTEETERRGRDEEEHAERALKEEERRREDAEERAARWREEAEKRAERRRDEGERGKPKARLVGTLSESPRP